MKILVCSDFHGNTDMTNQLQNIIDKHKIDLFCYTGDIQQMRSVIPVSKNEQYIDNVFFSKIEQLSIPSYIIPGNTDYKFIVDDMAKKYKDTKMHVSSSGFNIEFDKFSIVMYPKVCFSNHCLKEFESFDKYKTNFNKTSLLTKQVFLKQHFDLKNLKQLKAEDGIIYKEKYFDIFENYYALPQTYKQRFTYIYDDLQNLINKCNKEKPILLLTHVPPHNTVCDALYGENKEIHVGSYDMRKIIEENDQIKISVSGHIHQTVVCNKDHQYYSFIQQQNNSSCQSCTVGNSGIDESLANTLCYIVIDTDEMKVQRFEQHLDNCQFQYTFSRPLYL